MQALGIGVAVLGSSDWRSFTLAETVSGLGLGELDRNVNFDIGDTLNNFFGLDNETNPYVNQINLSHYTDLECFTSTYKNSKKPFFLSLNICSLNSKYDELKHLIHEISKQNINVLAIAIQEIWQIPHPDLYLIDDYSLMLSQRKSGRGGGVGFYVKNGLDSKVCNNLSLFHEKIFECLTIEITFAKKRHYLCNIYRSPTYNSLQCDSFFELFDETLNKMDSIDHPYFIFTDSNFNLFKIASSNPVQKYLETLHNNGFLQIVKKATRIQGPNTSLIDHICIKNCSNIPLNGTIISDLSDHFINFVQLTDEKISKNSKMNLSRNMSKTNMIGMRSALEQISWNSVLAINDVNVAFEEFWSTFKTLYDLYFPLTQSKFNRNIHKINDYLTKGLLISRNKKNLLHKTYIKTPNQLNEMNYKTYRNLYNTLIRKSKKLHLSDKLFRNRKNPKKTWEIFNEAISKKKPNTKISEIESGNVTHVDDSIIAEEFNKFFVNIGQNIANSIENVNIKPEDYLTFNDDTPSLKFDKIGPIYICDILKSMDPKKSKDLDGLSSHLLKFLNTTISVPLAHIFNLSLENGTYPDRLKSSRVVPIFKDGNAKLCDNYRPITIVSTLAKILDKIVATKLYNHLDINKLIYKFQFGFQKNLSTENNLLHLTNYITKAINDGKFCIGIFLDLRKAFDVVNHDILLKKLSYLGIKNTELKWFASYLSNRFQCTDINGKLSTFKAILISVMQGSVLGPLLFLCFINDMYKASKLTALLFADDTACLASHNDIDELVNFCNTELQKLSNWFAANRISVNVKKCKFILFHNKGKKINTDNLKLSLNINEHDPATNLSNVKYLDRITSNSGNPDLRTYKYLGILLDENLSFTYHIDYLCKKLSRGLFYLKRIKSLVNEKDLKTIYFTVFHSHLLYCSTIVGCTSISNIKRICTLQKKAIRIITSSKYNAHTAPLFNELKIMPFDYIIQLQNLKHMHSIVYEYAHESFAGIWTRNINRLTEHNLRNNDDFTLPAPHYENFKRYPLYSFPFAWNNLGDVKLQRNKTTFRIALTDQLFDQLVSPTAE